MMLNTLIEADGKIGVVALVLAIIMAGLGLYLFYLDAKVRRMEKQLRHWDEEHKSETEHHSEKK